MVILIVMLAFSFIGGLLSPYKQQQVFRKQEAILHEYASGSLNQDLRYIVRDGESFSNIAAANFVLAKNNGTATFEHGGVQVALRIKELLELRLGTRIETDETTTDRKSVV